MVNKSTLILLRKYCDVDDDDDDDDTFHHSHVTSSAL